MALAATAQPSVQQPPAFPAARKLTIAFVIGSSEVGGAEHVILMLLRHLPRERFTCHIICPARGPMVERYRQAVSPSADGTSSPAVTGPARLAAGSVITIDRPSFFHPAAVLEIAAALRRLRADVVHTCLYTSDAAGLLAARLIGIRSVAHIVSRNFALAEERGLRWAGKRAESAVYRGIYAFADRLLAVSEAVKADLVGRSGIRVGAGKITVLRHSPPPDALLASEQAIAEAKRLLRLTDETDVITMVASCIPMKGHRYLLEAMPRILEQTPHAVCAMVGDGPHRQALERLATELGVSRQVVFTGTLDDQRKNAVMRLSRLIVLPSLSEGLPVSLLEAMAFGKPIIATPAGGIGELVEDGVTGLLVPARDAASLGAAITRLLTDVELSARMGAAGWRRFNAQHDFSDSIARFASFYQELAG